MCVLGGGGGGGVHLATSMHYNHVIALFPGLITTLEAGKKELVKQVEGHVKLIM